MNGYKVFAKHKVFTKNILYYLAYVIWFSGSMLFGRSTLETFLGISSVFWLKKVCYPICAVLILTVLSLSGFLKRTGKKQYLVIGLLIGLFGISWLASGWGTYFMELMFLIAAKEIDLEKLPRVTLAAQCVIIPLIILLALTGTIENVSYMYERMNQAPVYRQALGLRHPNAMGAQMVQFCICFLWIRWKKRKWWDYLVYMASIGFIYTICNSITSVSLILLIAVIDFSCKYLYPFFSVRNLKSVCGKIMGMYIWGVPILCILTGYFYPETSPLVVYIDHMVAWRFKIANLFLQNYPASLLGSRLPELVCSDILYIDTIVRYGCIILFLILFGICRLMKYAIRENMYPLVISIFIYTLYGITEQCPYQLMYNFTLIYLVNVIYGKAKIKQVKGKKERKKRNGGIERKWV